MISAARPIDSVFYYHGTNLAKAKELMTQDISVQDVPMQTNPTDEFSEYTDFGKGFYTNDWHSKKLAFDWAKRKHAEWGVVRFELSSDDVSSIEKSSLYFANKKSRPANAPTLSFGRPASWLEFVSHNRSVVGILRPKDNDWTVNYAAMKGPLWVPQDSGIKKPPPPFPDDQHQINFGQAGLKLLNSDEAKKNRYLYSHENDPGY